MSDGEAKLASDRNKIHDRKKELEKKEREAFWGLQMPPHWQNNKSGGRGAGAGAGGSRVMSPCDSSNSNDEEKNAASSPESDERGDRGERRGEPAAGRAARRSGGGVSDLISTINKDFKVAKQFALARSKAAAKGSPHRGSSASQEALFNQ